MPLANNLIKELYKVNQNANRKEIRNTRQKKIHTPRRLNQQKPKATIYLRVPRAINPENTHNSSTRRTIKSQSRNCQLIIPDFRMRSNTFLSSILHCQTKVDYFNSELVSTKYPLSIRTLLPSITTTFKENILTGIHSVNLRNQIPITIGITRHFI